MPRVVAQEALSAEVYARVFVNHAEGAQILEELAQRFGGNPYRKGGLEGDRQTCFHAGENNVVNFITSRIATASGAPDHEPEHE